MRKFIPRLLTCSLFDGLKVEEIEKLMSCFRARTRKFEKDSYIFMENDEISAMGVVISGAVHVLRDDFWGNRTIIARIAAGDVFAESFACGKTGRIPFSVMAVEKTEALFIHARKINAICATPCPFHTRVLNNMINELAVKNTALVNKMQHITRRTTREKLISYLSERAGSACTPSQAFTPEGAIRHTRLRAAVKVREDGISFDIPFNREELAEFLSVDRSAMSSELARMKTDGLLTFSKNHFTLFKKQRNYL